MCFKGSQAVSLYENLFAGASGTSILPLSGCDDNASRRAGSAVDSKQILLDPRMKTRCGGDGQSSWFVSSGLYFETADAPSGETVERSNRSLLKIIDIRCWLS